jgi:hypothetical protein
LDNIVVDRLVYKLSNRLVGMVVVVVVAELGNNMMDM